MTKRSTGRSLAAFLLLATVAAAVYGQQPGPPRIRFGPMPGAPFAMGTPPGILAPWGPLEPVAAVPMRRLEPWPAGPGVEADRAFRPLELWGSGPVAASPGPDRTVLRPLETWPVR